MTTIIVPTDFSTTAYKALFYATRLAPQEKCKILVVHSYQKELAHELSILDPIQNESIVHDLRATIQGKLEALEHKIMLDSVGLDLKIEVFYGSQALHEMINELIANLKVSCVVMGTKGASGLKEVFLGSQAVSVVKNVAPIPLFLISNNTDFKAPKNVAYAADFKSDYHKDHYAFLKELLKNHQAHLNISHVYDPMNNQSGVEPHYKNLKEKLEDVEFTMHWIANTRGVEADLELFCKEHNIDLLVLTYHKYGFFKSLMKTSLVEKASFHLEVPLLILPESA